MREEFLLVEKYRPRTVAETILPDNIKATFQQFVDKNEIPNLMLPGGAGTGKTTIARALCEQVGADYIIINGDADVAAGEFGSILTSERCRSAERKKFLTEAF